MALASSNSAKSVVVLSTSSISNILLQWGSVRKYATFRRYRYEDLVCDHRLCAVATARGDVPLYGRLVLLVSLRPVVVAG